MTLRLWGGALLLTIGLVALVSGCGSATAEDKSAKEMLVTLDDLPSGAQVAEPFPEPCGPIPTLEEGRTKVAVTKPLGYGPVVMREVLAIFPDTELATAAYEDLTSPERAECIRGALEELGPSERIEQEPPASFEVADDDSDLLYRSFGSDGRSSGTVDAVSLRSGSCVATLIFISEGKPQEGVEEVSGAAADLLPDDCRWPANQRAHVE